MKNPAHPEAILRLAWNTHRLDAIRHIVEETVRMLQTADPRTVLGRDLSALEQQAEHNPVGQALLACCNDLRHGCGLPPFAPPDAGDVVSAAEPQSDDWHQSYGDALERYRDAAGAALQAAFDKAAGAVGPSTTDASDPSPER